MKQPLSTNSHFSPHSRGLIPGLSIVIGASRFEAPLMADRKHLEPPNANSGTL
jgi:hypothetical protein